MDARLTRVEMVDNVFQPLPDLVISVDVHAHTLEPIVTSLLPFVGPILVRMAEFVSSRRQLAASYVPVRLASQDQLVQLQSTDAKAAHVPTAVHANLSNRPLVTNATVLVHSQDQHVKIKSVFVRHLVVTVAPVSNRPRRAVSPAIVLNASRDQRVCSGSTDALRIRARIAVPV